MALEDIVAMMEGASPTCRVHASVSNALPTRVRPLGSALATQAERPRCARTPLTHATRCRVLRASGEGLRISRLTQGSQDNIMKISKGCTVLSYEPGSEHDVGDKKGQLACPLRILTWRSDSFIKPLVNKDERHMIK